MANKKEKNGRDALGVITELIASKGMDIEDVEMGEIEEMVEYMEVCDEIEAYSFAGKIFEKRHPEEAKEIVKMCFQFVREWVIKVRDRDWNELSEKEKEHMRGICQDCVDILIELKKKSHSVWFEDFLRSKYPTRKP